MTELNWLTAAKLAKLFKKGKANPVDVAEACFAQIERFDGRINAMCHLDRAGALASAAQSAERWRKGEPLSPLDGVPTLIKDLLLVTGWPTLRGSKTVEPNQAWDQDAPSVARLKEAGAVLLGATTTPEFGWKGVTDSPLTGITRNPWNLEKTPGGSSGGSAAAVVAGYAPLSLGTDGGGSIRIPAGFTGVFGHKPSFGRVPAFPLSPFGTVAHVGPMTRTVEDAALMMNEIARPDARDWTSLPPDDTDYVRKLDKGVKGLRIAYSPTLGYVQVDPQVLKAVDAAVATLAALGAEVEKVDPGFDDPGSCFRTLWWAGAYSLLGQLPDEKKALLDKDLLDVVRQAEGISMAEYLAATRERGLLGSHMRQFMERYDLLVTPSLPGPAFAAGVLGPTDSVTGKWVNWTPFSYPFNLTQQPAASVPCGFTAEGLPIGLHLVGRMFDDRTVLRAAHAYEQAQSWGKFRPKMLS